MLFGKLASNCVTVFRLCWKLNSQTFVLARSRVSDSQTNYGTSTSYCVSVIPPTVPVHVFSSWLMQSYAFSFKPKRKRIKLTSISLSLLRACTWTLGVQLTCGNLLSYDWMKLNWEPQSHTQYHLPATSELMKWNPRRGEDGLKAQDCFRTDRFSPLPCYRLFCGRGHIAGCLCLRFTSYKSEDDKWQFCISLGVFEG